MKTWALILTVIGGVVALGCAVEAEPNSPANYYKFSVSELGRNSGHWRLVELEYEGTKYVFLQNYDTNNQALVKVTRLRFGKRPESLLWSCLNGKTINATGAKRNCMSNLQFLLVG